MHLHRLGATFTMGCHVVVPDPQHHQPAPRDASSCRLPPLPRVTGHKPQATALLLAHFSLPSAGGGAPSHSYPGPEQPIPPGTTCHQYLHCSPTSSQPPQAFGPMSSPVAPILGGLQVPCGGKGYSEGSRDHVPPLCPAKQVSIAMLCLPCTPRAFLSINGRERGSSAEQAATHTVCRAVHQQKQPRSRNQMGIQQERSASCSAV